MGGRRGVKRVRERESKREWRGVGGGGGQREKQKHGTAEICLDSKDSKINR